MSHTVRQGRPTIGVLAGWQFAWTPTPLSYLDPIFRGADQAAHDLGCNLLLGCGMGPWTDHSDSLRTAWPLVSPDSDFVPIGPWNTAGLVAVNPLHSEARSRYVHELRAAGHPLIFVAAGESGPSIVADNRGGVLAALKHLVQHGHRHIAFIAGSMGDLEGDTGERLRAYHDAVKALGLDTDPRLVAWGRHIYEGGQAAMRQILASGVSLSAVLASNDESALGAIEALSAAGYRTPQDVAVIGFDDRPESAVQQPALSSVRVSLRTMGYRAVESLYRYLTGQAETIESARVATRLVPRESCGCGPTARRIAAVTAAAPQIPVPGRTVSREQLVQTMAASILTEAQGLSPEEVAGMCRRLVEALDAGIQGDDPASFEEALEAVIHQLEARGEDVYAWQGALSSLGSALDGLQPASSARATEWLDRARLSVSAGVQRQYRQHVVDQRWRLNRLGTLASRLLAALDETQIYDVLARHLPTMGIDAAWLALFNAEGDGSDRTGSDRVSSDRDGSDRVVAWTTLRDITAPDRPVRRFPSREFPPEGLLPTDRPFCLALFPLTGPRGQRGYVAFDVPRRNAPRSDAPHLDLSGAITQELATALNSAELYREASEGRRLAEEANELKSRFLATVSHELRTPLNLVVGLSGILLQDSDESDMSLPEPYRRDVEAIHANAQHLGGLIDDVLDLASSDAGQLRLANEFVDLGQALGLVAESGRRLAYEHGLVWQADLPESGPWVWGDRTRLRQVALNLVNNAIKFTVQGHVHLEVTTSSDAVTVAVHDTGLGIPLEEQDAIFSEFHRSERSLTRGIGGLGLGLAICKRLIDLHGGTIGLRSSGEEGGGSTFYFTLPTVKPPTTRVGPAAIPAEPEARVLVLASRTDGSRRLDRTLEARGFKVERVFADETPEWLSQAVRSEPGPPGAIVVDMGAAPQQSWHVLRAIKGHPQTRDLPVLFCALSAGGGSVLEFDYLTKPIEPAELTRALDQQWLLQDRDHDVRTVLIVDDDPGTLEMYARTVEAHYDSCRVLTACNGLEALTILQKDTIHLVLLDLIMPGLDGFGVLEAMRDGPTTREIPVIVLTGQVLTDRDMARLSRGVARVLGKGLFSLEETLSHVDAALDRNRRLSAEAQRLVRQAMAYVHQHYSEAISRADLARHVALSPDYLTVSFRRELGVTPVAYLNRYRVNQAKQLLTETSKTVTEIALEVGFSDSSYFSRVFRREVGLSPEAYRQA